jgi:hypothetical protein
MAGQIDRAPEQPDQRNGRESEQYGDVAALIPIKALPRPGEHIPHDGLRYVFVFGGVRVPP